MDRSGIITENGLKLRPIQIEGDENEYLMDDEGNIYDGEGNFIGTMNGDDDEDEDENY